MTKIEIHLELTQEEADKVAAQLESLAAYIRQVGELDRQCDAELFSDVAQALRNATRDAQQRASDDDHHALVNRDN